MIHDAFQPVSYWKNFMPPPQYQRVILDTHIYQIFSDAVRKFKSCRCISKLILSGQLNALSYDQHIQTACGMEPDLTSSTLWLVVGEWVPVATDCAKYLNGRGRGSRYDGTFAGDSNRVGSCEGLTGKASTFSSSYKTFLRQYWEAQVITYEKVQGWIQWTWKTEDADEWSYQAGLANGWIPQNPTDYMYPNICG